MLIKKSITVFTAVVTLGFSALAFAGNPAPTCGSNPFQPAHQCCYGNKEYSIGSHVKEAGTVMVCVAPDLNYQTSARFKEYQG
ncbi:hypothetical protein B1757_02470 [Acidithiobacillus marinus]|uniref:DUF1496 domain-containing protein n=1 Tax=Acidithiobacillus marinus TaxID=187490 RepID=A0A2I1DPK1_9PROT|nr:DUF1496 domain-containing protein [Acidithiobacillus marinus]PKY11844.1 hypothetical protein B1757_02470 [Acidithiobacillus marinus]